MSNIIRVASSGLPLSIARDVVAELKRGASVLLPTDTVYGLAADPLSRSGEKRLFEAKLRPEGKPVALLAFDCDQIERWGAVIGERERELAKRFWPGALTMVLPIRCEPGADPSFEGFRIPNHPVALSLLKELGHPMRVSSANISGEPPALTASDALRRLAGSIDLALDAGPVSGGVPSTVVRIFDGSYRILRAGAISTNELAPACKLIGLTDEPANGA